MGLPKSQSREHLVINCDQARELEGRCSVKYYSKIALHVKKCPDCNPVGFIACLAFRFRHEKKFKKQISDVSVTFMLRMLKLARKKYGPHTLPMDHWLKGLEISNSALVNLGGWGSWRTARLRCAYGILRSAK